VFGSTTWSRILGALVAVAGAGYLVDAFGTILLPDYGLTVSLVTFVGEALLIVRLLWLAFGRRTDRDAAGAPAAAAGDIGDASGWSSRTWPLLLHPVTPIPNEAALNPRGLHRVQQSAREPELVRSGLPPVERKPAVVPNSLHPTERR
jgi:hypothetical protein